MIIGSLGVLCPAHIGKCDGSYGSDLSDVHDVGDGSDVCTVSDVSVLRDVNDKSEAGVLRDVNDTRREMRASPGTAAIWPGDWG